ncbi:MAG: hypothetical protein L0Y66_06210 [Myxococcaceae bacterium]|nr:hypothetical protein [Myxococcaceae bacterium]
MSRADVPAFRTSARYAAVFVAFAGWALALLLAHHPVLLSGFQQTQGDEGDVRFVHYVLEHGWRFVRGEPAHARFWDMPMFHPALNTTAYSEVMLGVGPLYWPWRAAGIPADTAFQLWLLSVTSLNFLSALWLLRVGVGVVGMPAVVGALLFSAGSSRVNQANHPQLFAQFYCVLAVGALLLLLRPGTSRRAGLGWSALLVGACVAQLYAGFYWGWFLGFFLLLAGLVALGFRDTRARLVEGLRRHGLALLGCGLLGLVALLPLARHTLDAAREVGLRDFGEVKGMLPRFATWLNMGDASWLYGWTARFHLFQRLPVEGEHRVGLGLVTFTLAALGLWRMRHQPLIRVLLVVTVAGILLTSRYRGGWTPWWLIAQAVPGGDALRAVCRVGIWLLLPASLGVALALARFSSAGRTWTAAVLGAVCLLEQGVRGAAFEVGPARADVARLAAHVAPDCRSFLYSPTAGGFPSWKYQLDAAWASLELGVPTVNGYSGKVPPGWPFEEVLSTDAARAAHVEAGMRRWTQGRGLAENEVCLIQTAALR